MRTRFNIINQPLSRLVISIIGFCITISFVQGQEIFIKPHKQEFFVDGQVYATKVFVRNPQRKYMRKVRVFYKKKEDTDYLEAAPIKYHDEPETFYYVQFHINPINKKSYRTLEKQFDVMVVYNKSRDYRDMDTIYAQGDYKVKYFKLKETQLETLVGEEGSLYWNCANHLRANNPAFTKYFYPSFKVPGCEISRLDSVNFSIVPVKYNERVLLKIISGGRLLYTQQLKMKSVPAPTLKLSANHQEIDMMKGIAFDTSVTVKIELIPNPSFQKMFPEECQYLVEGSLFLMKENRILEKVEFKKGEIKLSSFMKKREPGTFFRFIPDTYQRVNGKNRRVGVSELKKRMYDFPVY